MKAYLDILSTVLDQGVLKPNRTGVDTLSYFCYPFRHDLAEGFPLLTTKDMSGPLWNSLIHELLWFISGENHIRNFREKSKIWNAWADESWELETAYGFYWRNFPYAFDGIMHKKWESSVEDLFWSRKDGGTGNFDQLGWCVEQLKTNPNNRRLVVSAWEPFNAHKSKLPPCHFAYVFNVSDGRLCLHMTQRSCDLFLGVPFNIASYSLLTHIIAREAGLEPGIVSIMFVDAHIYCADKDDKTILNGLPKCEYDHIGPVREQLQRTPYELPQIKITGGPWDQHKFEDFELVGYKAHPRIKAKVVV